MTLSGRALRRAFLGLFLGLSVLAATGRAAAQELANTEREVRLFDGSVVRGQLVELIPNQRVVLRLVDGRLRSIAWPEVAGIAEPPPVTPVAAVPQMPTRPCDDEILALIRSDHPIELFERPEDAKERRVFSLASASAVEPFRRTCLRKRGEYRVGGKGVASEEFRLPEAGSVQLDIKTGPRGQRIAGTVMLIGGPIVAAPGALILVIGLFSIVVGGLDSSVLIAGVSLLATGAAITLVGGIVYGTAGTSVRLSPVYGPVASVRLTAGLRLSGRGLEF